VGAREIAGLDGFAPAVLRRNSRGGRWGGESFSSVLITLVDAELLNLEPTIEMRCLSEIYAGI
jgi:hypothetical protein